MGSQSESEQLMGGGPMDSQSEPEQSLMGGGPCWAAAVELATLTTEAVSDSTAGGPMGSQSEPEQLMGGGPMDSQSEPEHSLLGGPCFLGGPPCFFLGAFLAGKSLSSSC